MSIIDRARDASRSARAAEFHWIADTLAECAAFIASQDDRNDELDRASDARKRASTLADSLEARAEGDEYSPAEQSAYRVAAQELRAALEGAEE